MVHTPPELARFVTRAAATALTEELGLEAGLAHPSLILLDPACGPGAFLAAALALLEATPESGGGGARGPALHGWDVDEGAIRDARALLTPAAEILGRRLGLRLELRAGDSLRRSAEGLGAGPLLILGNPPWSARRRSRDPERDRLLRDFRLEQDGSPLRERKLGVLSDDYVRFFRWAAELARGRREGAVVALLTNSSYLDGAVHRGMRGALLRWFDRIEITDLGGSSLVARGPRPDDNLFRVRPGVALAVLSRRPRAARPEGARARLLYARLYGRRGEKREALLRGSEPEPRAHLPRPPFFRFVPRRSPEAAHYEAWPSLDEALPFHREGLQSNRDALVTGADRGALLERLRLLASGSLPGPGGSGHHFRWPEARASLASLLEEDPEGERLLRPVAYRPFEVRWAALHRALFHRPRPSLCASLCASPFALISVRKDRGDKPWAHFAAATLPIDNCFLSAASSCRARAFPSHDPEGRENLAPALWERWSERIGAPLRSEAFLAYTLAVLASRSYRSRYEEELRIDYPRIPPPPTAEAFEALRAIGLRLVEAFSAPLTVAASSGDAARWTADPDALGLVIGHHRPLARARARGVEEREREALEARLGELLALLVEAEERVAPVLVHGGWKAPAEPRD